MRGRKNWRKWQKKSREECLGKGLLHTKEEVTWMSSKTFSLKEKMLISNNNPKTMKNFKKWNPEMNSITRD